MGTPPALCEHTVGVEIGVRLMIAGSQGEADVVCSLLRANGIECGDRAAPEMYPGRGGGWGGPREVVVREADLDAARELVDAPTP